MDEKPVDHPGVPQDEYHKLGPKTLWIFVLQRVNAAAAFLLLAVVLFAIKDEPFLKLAAPVGDLRPYANIGAWAVLGIFVIVFFFTFLVAWLIYINYKYMLGDDSLKIKRGILNKEEVAMPYRQIQDVDIERDLSFQMMGLSRIVILTAGHEDEKPEDDESEGILPAMDKDLAEWLQAELLKRANVQKVVETK
ncbi:MAG TPA: PH domain-containing protein [Candidatus Paceibacterota bacterium]|nr:PH domain-containing protein [Candidatus Paceibacterota bacterium]